MIEAKPLSGQQEGIVETAMQLKGVNVLPDSVYNKMVAATGNKKTSLNAALTDIQNYVCPQGKARFAASFTVQYIPPKAPQDTPLDTQAKALSDYATFLKVFLKEKFFNAISEYDFDANINPDFEEYHRNVIQTDGERKTTQSFSVFVPAATSNRLKDIESYYSNLRFTPLTPDLEDHPDNWHSGKYVLVLMNPTKRLATITPKITPLLQATWNDTNVSTKVENYYIGEMTARDPATIHNLQLHAAYAVSDSAYEINGEKLYPLQFSYAQDLALLKKYFVLLINKETQEKIEIGPTEDGTFWGYQGDQMSMSEMQSVRELLWRKVLAYSTTVKMSGDRFQLDLDMSLICRFLRPITETNGQ